MLLLFSLIQCSRHERSESLHVSWPLSISSSQWDYRALLGRKTLLILLGEIQCFLSVNTKHTCTCIGEIPERSDCCNLRSKQLGLQCLAQSPLGSAQEVNWHPSSYQSTLHNMVPTLRFPSRIPTDGAACISLLVRGVGLGVKSRLSTQGPNK